MTDPEEKGTKESPIVIDYDPELAKVRCDVKMERLSELWGHCLIPCGRKRPCPKHPDHGPKENE